jgi:hypothetical protein
MRSVTPDEAAEIGLTRFYRGTGLDLLAAAGSTVATLAVLFYQTLFRK